MSKKISRDGKHFVQIKETRWEQCEGKNGAPDYMCLVVEGINSDEETAEGRIFFSRELCQKGKFAGRPRYEESMAKCIELGMTPPFSPTKTGPMPYEMSKDQLCGAQCEFVMETSEKYGCQVKYINVARREPLTADKVSDMWKQLTGGAPPAQTTAPTTTAPTTKPADPLGDDDIPFDK